MTRPRAGTAAVHTLYGAPCSGSAAVEMGLRAAGLPYEIVTAATWKPGPGYQALLQVNPLGQIPTLVLPDGTVLTESAAILIHLGLCHPDSGLLPTEPGARALALRGLVYLVANAYPAVSVSDYPERWTTATTAPARARVGAAARTQVHRSWEIFADTFGKSTPLARPQPGALAFLAVVVSQWSGARAHLQTQRPAFHRLLLKLEAHPRLAPVLQAHRAAD